MFVLLRSFFELKGMKTVTKLTTIPENSVITSGFDKIDYFDTYRVVKITNDNAEKIAAEIFKLPNWALWLMKIRDFIVGFFGLKTSKEKRVEQATYFQTIVQNENEIVMGENDKHLDFRTSVLVDREKSFIYLITVVCFNNFLGKIYFLTIKPFHKIIVKSILNRNL